MGSNAPISVLSLNMYMMGHVTFQTILEQVFTEQLSTIAFTSLHLTDYFKQDLWARVMHRLLRSRLPGIPHHRDDDYFRFRNELGNSIFARRCLERSIRHHRPQVLHIHTQGIALLMAPLLRRTPGVVSIDYTTALLAREHPAPARRTYQPIVALERRVFQAAAHVVSCSARARDSVVRDYGIPSSNVTHIDYPLLLEQFVQMPRPKFKESSNTPPYARDGAGDRVRLLFIGNDVRRKGGDDLLAVFLADFADTCTLDLVTNDAIPLPEHPYIRIHRGLRPLSPELLDLYRQADIYVMPTREDVYGIVFQEAMAAGLPCIGSTSMAVPELVQDGMNGFAIPPGDRAALAHALHTLVTDPSLRLTMGQHGRKLAIARFDPLINCTQLADIFYQVSNPVESFHCNR